MTHTISPIKIIENCIADKTNNPLKDIMEQSTKFNKLLVDKIYECVKTILSDTQFNKYPNLALQIHNYIFNDVLIKQQKDVYDNKTR
jgi:hypothetical protein